MKKLVKAMILLAAAFLLSGCATTAMKGTPFFTGESESRTGKVEDRVNAWPLLYYREPSLSVLWPIGEYEPENRFAIRPLFSTYKDSGKREYNVLYPLSHFEEDNGWIFPVWWEGDGFGVFPLYWHFEGESNFVDALFPLWIYVKGRRSTEHYFLWPIFYRQDSEKQFVFRVFPLFSYRDNLKNDENDSIWWLGGLGGHRQNTDWFLPFYLNYNSKDEQGFYTLPWFSRSGPSGKASGIPLLLSWKETKANGDESLDVLVGLFRSSTSSTGERSGRFIPFYAYEPDLFLSLPYSHIESETRTYDILPLLLSWQSQDSATGTEAMNALGGLYHQRRGTDGLDRAWLFPAYYRDQQDGLFLSPLWASRKDSWRAVPPLLSWRSHDAATGADSDFVLGGLFHRRRGVAGLDRDWLFPLYYRDQHDGIFVSPLWARDKDSWSAIPPLLSWQSHDPDTGADSIYSLGGLFHRRRGAEGLDRDWLLPFYFRDEASSLFLSPLYAKSKNTTAFPLLLAWRNREKEGSVKTRALLGLVGWERNAENELVDSYAFPFYQVTGDSVVSLAYVSYEERNGNQLRCIPPLLSWQSHDPATGRKDTFGLLGLFMLRTGVPEGQGASRLLPFYAYDAEAGYFLTPLFGHFGGEGVMKHYWFTPLVGTTSGRETGWWVFPICGRLDTADEEKFWVLWGSQVTDHEGDSARASFFPIFSWERRGDLEAITQAMDTGVPLNTTNHVYASASSRYLLLGGNRHRAEARADAKWNLPATNSLSTTQMVYTENADAGFFPVWGRDDERRMVFEGNDLREDATCEKFSILYFLYDRRYEYSETKEHEYIRKRVLWHLWHYEKLNGDVSVDVFPAITYDRRADGFKKTSFLWRFFRYEKSPEGGRKLDLLFLPILRRNGANAFKTD